MNKEIIAGLAWGLSMVALAIGATSARKLGYVDADTVTRVVYGSIGLMTAWFGNRIPKTFFANAQARRAQRIAGWSTVLSGLIYAAFWGGSGAILAGFAVTIGYCLSLKSKANVA